MVFSDKDKILIQKLHDSKGYRGYDAKKLIKKSFTTKVQAKVDYHAAWCLTQKNL